MMHEEKTKMTRTVFGEVLAELLEARDMPPAIPYVRGLMRRTGTDGEKLIERIEDAHAPHPGDATMAALSDRLELTMRERRELAFAFSYEMRSPKTPEVPEMTDEQVKVLWSRIQRLDAINTAIATVEDNPQPNSYVQEETLEELRTLSEEVNREVKQMKKEYGFKDY